MSSLDRFRLDGKVAFIPGGGVGIGSALACGLAAAGADVSVVERTRELGEPAAEKVRASGCRSLVVAGDMTKEEDADRAVAETVAELGRLDIIINAIGGGAGKVLFPVHEYPRDAWDWIFELNVRANLLPTQAAARAMIAADRGGRVLNISSVRAQLGINAGYSRSTPSPPPSSTPHRSPCSSTTRISSRASCRASPSAGWAPPTTCWGRCCSSAPMRPRSSRGRS